MVLTSVIEITSGVVTSVSVHCSDNDFSGVALKRTLENLDYNADYLFFSLQAMISVSNNFSCNIHECQKNVVFGLSPFCFNDSMDFV